MPRKSLGVFLTIKLYNCVTVSLWWASPCLFRPQLDSATDFEERRMIRAALRDLLKKKRGKSQTLLFSKVVAARCFKNVLISWMLCCLSSDKREQERGSRQQDLKDQGLGRGGTTGVSVGRAAMNQQTPAKSTFGDALPDMMPHFNALFKSCGLADNLVMCFLLRAARSNLTISRRVSQFYLICMFGLFLMQTWVFFFF